MRAFYFFFYPLLFFPFGTKAKLRTGGTRSADFGLRRLKNPFRQNEEWRTYGQPEVVLLCVLRSTKFEDTFCVSVISPLLDMHLIKGSAEFAFLTVASYLFGYPNRNLVGGYTPLQPLCSHSRCQTSLTSEMTCINTDKSKFKGNCLILLYLWGVSYFCLVYFFVCFDVVFQIF